MDNKNTAQQAIDVQDRFRRQFSSLGRELLSFALFVSWRLPKKGALGHLHSFLKALVLASPDPQRLLY